MTTTMENLEYPELYIHFVSTCQFWEIRIFRNIIECTFWFLKKKKKLVKKHPYVSSSMLKCFKWCVFFFLILFLTSVRDKPFLYVKKSEARRSYIICPKLQSQNLSPDYSKSCFPSSVLSYHLEMLVANVKKSRSTLVI